jgi:Ca-activated chloride channel family protein
LTARSNHYTLLGVSRNATSDQLRRAYRQAALEYHPDRTDEPEDAEIFLRISQAYETLIDPESRRQYDKELAKSEEEQAKTAQFRARVLHSRARLLPLDEPQVHYLLIDIFPQHHLSDVRPPVNLAIVIDRSTSMKGARLDQVRTATQQILQSLRQGDTAAVVAFSDKAELIVSPDQARDLSIARARMSLLQADGGTEIGQGLTLGFRELEKNFTREGVNHLILLTDGRTYGDEELCIRMANAVAQQGITINGVGIGGDWSDRFLDELASTTGGSVLFLDNPKAITGLLDGIVRSLNNVVASRMLLNGSLSQLVDLRSSFRLLPEPMVLGDRLPLTLGHLPREGKIQVLLEVVIHPIGNALNLTLAHFTVSGDVLGEGSDEHALPVPVEISVSDELDPEPPPEEVTQALGALSLYRMQDKARHEAELGQLGQAARRLESLATQLLAAGQRELAKAALNEAENLSRSRRISTEGEKRLKYGTRALLLPARASSSEAEDD